MRRLPSSRSAKKSPVGPGKNDFKPENRYIATSPKHSAILQVKHLKATVITSRVAAELKTIRAIEKSDGKVVKLNPVLSQEKPEAAVKPVAKTVPLEKLQNLQALLNNKDIPVHVSKKARKVVVAPPISSAPIISKGIDPERAAKGKQYIKERKALELKKKKALAEKERQERERVCSFFMPGCICVKKD